MDRLNVYKNYFEASWGKGVLIVAAANKGEAHEICKNDEDVKDFYGEDSSMFGYYPSMKFELIEGLSYLGKPCIIEEIHYEE